MCRIEEIFEEIKAENLPPNNEIYQAIGSRNSEDP